MRRVLIAVGLVAVVLTGCGGTGANCGPIADEGIELLQEIIDEVDRTPAEQLEAAFASGGFIDDFEQRADEIDSKADAEGCSEEQIRELLNERAGALEADSEFGQVILDVLIEGDLFSD